MHTSEIAAMMGRRGFVKHFALSSAASIFGGKLWTAKLLAEVGPNGEPQARIPIRISDYPPLLVNHGSVQFKFTNFAGNYTYFPFTVTRLPGNLFHAVDTRCTHEGCVVDPYTFDPISMTGSMICPCHQSEYNAAGQVLVGPAESDLLRYPTEFDGVNLLSVFLPGVDLKINALDVQSSTPTTLRVRLQFPTIVDGRYRIQYRQNLNDTPHDTPFTTSAIGTPNLSQINGTGGVRTVYVDSPLPQGFFSVALVVDLL